jgi:uncharacterized coiled-coil protein SlyX
MVDLTVGHGLEIGPLDRPIAVRPDSDVSYLDVSERSKLQAHYGPDQTVEVEKIPELNFWLEHDDGFLSLEEACSGGAPFDWVLASHVIEHIPDVVGWLRQLWEVTGVDAEVALSVPDRRFCFDVHRPATTVGQALGAHDRGDQTPSPRAVFDGHRSAVLMPAERAWAGDVPDAEDRSHTWEYTLQMLERSRRGEYVDSHVWLWTPREFVSFIDDLCHLGLVDFVVDRMLATAHNDLEFHVVLARLPAGMDGDARDAHRERVHRAVLDGLPPERTVSTPERVADPDPGKVLEAEVAHLHTVIDALHVRVERQSVRIATLRDKVVAAQRKRDQAQRRVRRLQARLRESEPTSRPGLLSRLARRFRRASR